MEDYCRFCGETLYDDPEESNDDEGDKYCMKISNICQ
jgi:hypothetical protein